MSVPAARVYVCSLALAAVLAAAAALAGPNGRTTFRWTDDQGVVHYSDEIPPPAAGKNREIMNAQGVPVRQLEGAKTPQEAAADASARAAMIKEKQHDVFLVTTYTSVKDIEALRDSRLEQLKTQRAAAEQYIDTLRARLGTLQARAQKYRPYSAGAAARRMPDDLAEDLVRSLNDMSTQTAALSHQGEEAEKLREQFQADIDRYRELHTLHTN